MQKDKQGGCYPCPVAWARRVTMEMWGSGQMGNGLQNPN